MSPLSPEDKSEVEAIALDARRRARICPACKAEDSVYRAKCQECGAYCVDGVWKMPAAKPDPAPAAPTPPATPAPTKPKRLSPFDF